MQIAKDNPYGAEQSTCIKVALNQLLHCFVSTGVITVEDFLFTKDKHNSSDYPDDNTVDEVSPLFSIDLVLIPSN